MNNTIYTYKYKGKLMELKSLGTQSLPKLDEIISVHIIAFTNDKKIIAVNVISRGVDLPGGHVELGEKTPQETLTRETMEEARIVTQEPILVDVFEISSIDPAFIKKKYLLVYTAKIKKIHKFIPTSEISERLYLSQDELLERYFGDSGNLKRLTNDAAVKLGLK